MKVLVANRGEVACRIFRTLRAMGVPSAAVYTPSDAAAAHIYLADEALALDPALGPRGYLSHAALLAAARQSAATAIHPGYGFVSQSPQFAAACLAAGIVFIGPSAEAMASLGDKRQARQMAVAQQITVVPGVEAVETFDDAKSAADRVGYPVLIKAAGGGGGKGMRRVDRVQNLAEALTAAGREAFAAFGDARLLLEKCIAPARHIEVQVLGDGVRAIALGERECSLQRRYQKIIEESPALHITQTLRDTLEAGAVRLIEHARYKGAATVEFLVDAKGDAYFLEVNTRLQVEHPVTEWCRGLDIVEAQVALAHGGALDDVLRHAPFGHAIEVRLCAENPDMGFLPSTGRIEALVWPHGPGIRVDAGIEVGSVVGMDYDAMLAKIIAWAPTRALCHARLVAALEELVILGVVTNQRFLRALLQSEAFVSGQTFVTTVESQTWPLPEPPEAVLTFGQTLRHTPDAPLAEASVALGASAGRDRYSPWLSGKTVRTGPCGDL